MTIDEMKRLKKERSLTNAMIAKMTELPQSTVQKIFSGETKHPRFETLTALENVFHSLDVRVLQENTSLPWYGGDTDPDTSHTYTYHPIRAQMIAEPYQTYGTSALKNPGPFTVEDWRMLPDGERAELIDGQLIYMASPSITHQLIAGEIHRQIANFIYDHDGSCMPGIAPLGVQLDCDELTMVEPDVLVVCDPEKVEGRDVYGAPDFILEVLSPTTAKKDIFTKTEKYRNAGVREYWIIDPENALLQVFPYGFDEDAEDYDMTAPVPLRIFGGELKIDFTRILQWIEKNRKRSE
ncbi:MAG: Uma2 family endonuclease [Lachnospiraceae bacterium]|nr:Uma2 family endonuclease [Lachnospiraceae bacterium]